MSPLDLTKMTTTELLTIFENVCKEQELAILHDQHGKFRRLFSAMIRIEHELKSRSGDQRRELATLYNHASPQVRLHAAIATLALAPREARRVLQLIKDRNEYPQAADAWGILRSWDAGRYFPV